MDLATHTSGLPRRPANLLPEPVQPEDLLDRFARYDEADLFEFLASYELTVEPGTVEEYSNLGFGLLGYALSRADGTSYAGAIERHITQPLDMFDTTIALTDAQSEGAVAQGCLVRWQTGDAQQALRGEPEADELRDVEGPCTRGATARSERAAEATARAGRNRAYGPRSRSGA